MVLRYALVLLTCANAFCSQGNHDTGFDLFSDNHVNFLFIDQAQPDYPDGEKVLLGTLDVPLSEQGIEQTQQLKAGIERTGLVIDRIISSGLKRAYQTAEILAGSDMAVQQSAAFNETCKGDLEGLTRSQYVQKESYLSYKKITDPKESFFAPMGENGETKAHAALKIISCINEMRANPDLKGKTVVVITHGNPLKILNTLSANPKSLEAHDERELRESLNTVLSHEDPENCAVVYYRADEMSFQYIGRLGFDGKEIIIDRAPYPLPRACP